MSDERATSTFPAGMARSGRGAMRDAMVQGGGDPRRERPAFIVFGVFVRREKYADFSQQTAHRLMCHRFILTESIPTQVA